MSHKNPNLNKLRSKSCGKLRFRDHREAVMYLQRLENRGNQQLIERGFTNRREDRAYLCKLCKGFHLTSAKQYSIPRKHSVR